MLSQQVQTRDIGRILSLQRDIQKRKNRNQPTEKMEQKLAQLIETSVAKTQSYQQTLGDIIIAPDLPIAEHSSEIIELLQHHQVIIVAGETGCGKTTQLPKICLLAGLGSRGVIGHTQPRRVAATSVAKRIAEEIETPLGEKVGYAIRFANKYSENTRVKIMTDGVMLTEVEHDPLLSQYEVIIIDEAHERSLNIDFLMGFIKRILPKRKELKVIITSATIDHQRFSKHFNDAPVVTVEGRSYPVEVRYRPLADNDEGQDDPLINSIVDAVDECCAESTGDILIFADGEGQIKSIIKKLKHAANNQSLSHQWDIMPLYARLSVNEQQKIFAPSNKRKIIVSTNVAETSLTVPGIIFVIDIGNARISRFSQRNKIQQLPVEKIARASADQRKGRCGRIAPGICIRLYSEEDYLQRDEFTLPEIKRTNLSAVLLRLKAMSVANIENFPFIEVPDERAWKIAHSSLYELGALDNQDVITQIGKSMATIPVDPQLARILVDNKLTAVNEMLIFCALMSVREVRERPHDKQQKADQLHQKYHQQDSDVMTAISLWSQLEEQRVALSSSQFKKWCTDNLINFLGLLEWRRVYFQLKESVTQLGQMINQKAATLEEVHRALLPGFITHIFYRSQDIYYQGVRGLKVWLHPSSLSFKQKKAWMVSAEMIETDKFYARMNAEIKPEWVEEAAPHLLKSQYHQAHWRKKRGQVVAYVNQTLLGLPIVSNRLVNYASVDEKISREIFLKEGLAEDQLAEAFPFIKANREKLAYLEAQEQKQRLNNIRIDADKLAERYAQVLPTHILSVISLKRWLKKDFKARNRLLSFTLEQLTDNATQDPESYPSQLKVKGVMLNLSYCFAPGTPEDGVSVEIPANMLNQFSERDFDWLVPGYLPEKILATIKTLPKSIRRTLIPLSETAEHCYAQLIKIDQTGKRFLDELASVLQRITGIQIQVTDFDMSAVEPHLSMKYKVPLKQTSVLQSSLNELKQQISQKKQVTSISQKQKQLFNWPDGDFLLEKTIEQQQTIRIFQGMKDCQQFVEICDYPSLVIARRAHLFGVARLLLLTHKTPLNQFYKSWPDYQQLERLNLRFGGFKELFEMLALITAKQLIFDIHPITQKSVFDKVSQQFANAFRKNLAAKLTEIMPLLKQREKIYTTLASMNTLAYQDSIDDIRNQLKALWQIESLMIADTKMAENYSRYMTAIEVRLKRITTNYPKESQSMEIWQEWSSWWRDLIQHKNRETLQVTFDEIFWMLQEFRISLFSPGVKVVGGISAKKLQVQFENLEAALDTL
ncbi:ATP-dependent RNA helicase HrpA [Aliikangiella maris]|uniref:ATP-dependent RNA helicase HrpA n=2 Tax=Aliikangiella maris TaxID=3162458 RepID=A0ABV3MKD0_9GAMM